MPSLPPGPKGLLGPSYGYASNPLRYFSACARRYGDPFYMRTFIGDMFVTGQPDAIRTIFSADPDLFDSFSGEMLEPFAGKRSLVIISGNRHKRERKLLTPPLHGERMRAYGELIRAVTLRHIGKWRVGETFPLHDTLLDISLDVIIEAVFGVREDEKRARFRKAILRRGATMSPLIVVFKGLRRGFGGVGPWARHRRAQAELDALIYAELKARRKAGGEGDDILALLLAARYEDGGAMEDAAIRDELITLAVAGHETTAITLAWALYWLHRHPELRDKLLAEIAPLGDPPPPEALSRLPYLDAVCMETLRRTHPGTDVVRLLNRPLSVAGYDLPAGTGINVCIPLLHYREELFPEPFEFRPERFLERKYSPFEFIPFGGGHRRCIGAAFALYEIKVALASILSRCRLRLPSDKPVRQVRWNIFMAPEKGVPMVLDGPAA